MPMLQRLTPIALVTSLLAAQDDPLTGPSRAVFLKRVEKSMAKVGTVVAAFAQEKHLSLFGDVVKTSGCILYVRPDKLRWEIRKPFRSILIVSGTDVAKFEFQKGKRRRLELGRSGDIILMVMDQIRTWFRGNFESKGGNYDVRVYASNPPRIELRPKNKAMRKNLQAIELLLSKDLSAVDQVTIRERSGDKTVMRFRRLQKNAQLSGHYFDIRDPRVLDPDALTPKKQESRPTTRKSK